MKTSVLTRFVTLGNYSTKISTKLLFWALGWKYLARFKPNQATSSRRDSRAAMRNGDNANGIRTRLYNRVHIAHDQISNQLYTCYLCATKWRPSTTANNPSHNIQERPPRVIHHKLEHKAYCYIFLDQAEHSISAFLWHPPQYNLSVAQPKHDVQSTNWLHPIRNLNTIQGKFPIVHSPSYPVTESSQLQFPWPLKQTRLQFPLQ